MKETVRWTGCRKPGNPGRWETRSSSTVSAPGEVVGEPTGKFRKSHSGGGTVGGKRDGSGCFHCLATASNGPCLLINHSQYTPIPQQAAPPTPPPALPSSSLFSFQILSLTSPFSFHCVCSALSVLRASEHKLRYIKDERPRILPLDPVSSFFGGKPVSFCVLVKT